MLRRVLSPLFLFAFACVPRLAIDPGAVVSCDDTGVCPAGRECVKAIGRCVPSPAIDVDAPAALSFELSTRQAKVGTLVRASFSATERLAVQPILSLGANRAFQLLTFDGNVYELAYTVDGSEPEEDVTPALELYDEAANRAVINAPSVRFDFTRPSVTAVSSPSPSSLSLSFSEQMELDEDARFVFLPALTVTAMSIDATGTSITLTTAEQAPGVSFSLTMVGVHDRAGNVPANELVPVAGRPAAAGPPTLITPKPGDTAADKTQLVTWQAIAGASTYTIDVATDEAFSNLVLTRTVAAPATSEEVTVPNDVTYYLRIRADTNAPGDYSITSFEALGDALYVYCPASLGTRCATDPSGAGNRSKPFRSIARAGATAPLYGIGIVRVAKRDGDLAYGGILELTEGIDLYGGYDAPSFTTRSGRTLLGRTHLTAITCFGIAPPLVLDGFDAESIVSPSANVPSIGLQSLSCAHVTINNCRIASASGATTRGLSAAEGRIDVTGSEIVSGAPQTTSASTVAIAITNVNLHVTASTIESGNTPSGQTAAVVAEGSQISLTSSVVRSGTISGTGNSTAIDGTNSFVRVSGSTVSSGTGSSPSSQSVGISTVGTPVIVVGSRLRSGSAGGTSVAARLQRASVIVASELIADAGSNVGFGVQLNPARAVLLQDTIVAGAPTSAIGNAVQASAAPFPVGPTHVAGVLAYGRGSSRPLFTEGYSDVDPATLADVFFFGSAVLYHDYDPDVDFTDVCAGTFGISGCTTTLTSPTATGAATTATAATSVFVAPDATADNFELLAASPALNTLGCPSPGTALTFNWGQQFAAQAECDTFMPGSTLVGEDCVRDLLAPSEQRPLRRARCADRVEL